MKLSQRSPSPVAITKGVNSLIAGVNSREDGRWRVSSPPDGFKGSGTVGSGHFDISGVVGPDHQGTSSTSHRADGGDEDGPDEALEEVA